MHKKIHVNRQHIAQNKQDGGQRPVISCKVYKTNKHKTPFDLVIGNTCKIDGPSEFVYKPNNPLSCGARVWIQTDADVFIDDQEVN